MNLLDVLIVLVIVGASAYGYARGIVILVAGALGLVAGLVVGFVLAPHVVDWLGANGPRGRQLTVLVVMAASLGFGSAIAGLAITPFWVRLVGRSRDARAFDSVLGAALAGAVALGAAWLFTVSFDRGPSAELARLIQQSHILRKLESVAPTPPTLVIRVEQLLASNGNNTVIAGSGRDVIFAGGGNNKVSAGPGNDTITAGSGNDKIDGGPGVDTCNPGDGPNSVTNCENVQSTPETEDGEDDFRRRG